MSERKNNKTIVGFLAKCALFGVIILITLLAGEILIRNKVPNPYKFKHERLKTNSEDISTLLLGSSLTYYSLKPDELGDSCFNLAFPNQNYYFDNILLRKYPFPNLKRIIIPVFYDSFADPPFESIIKNYKIYMDYGGVGDISKYNVELSDLFVYAGKLRSLVNRRFPECDSLGFGLGYTIDKRNPHWQENGEYWAIGHTGDINKNKEFQIENLSEIIEYANQRGIEIVFVTPPAWSTYRQHLDRRQYEMTTYLADSIARKNNIRIINMIDDDRFEEKDFFDVVHLNENGAKKFSRLLKDTLAIGEKKEL